ncbi:PAS domain-containing protein [Streptomyces sp. NPDC020379]|uniref:PAS domain-containing protein n=1 Tax=Streptomyces sp. NPDC020379 TaxID=3365071 RepID=UPI0037BC7250
MSSRPSRGAARLAAILDALPDALLLVNCNGTVVNANHIALETFEVPGTGLVGRGLLSLLPDFDSRRIPGSMRLPDSDDGRTKPTRMVARRTDGSQFPVEVTSANLEDGRTPYADHSSYTGDELLMLVVRDLTGTLDTEAELARQQRQTEMILRAAAEGVVGVDTEGKVVLVNPSAAQILGYRASDLGGQELHPLVHHSRGDGTPFPYEESPIADTLRSGRKHRVRGQVLWAKDGRAVPVDLTTAPVRDGDQLVGAVMTFTDRRPYDALAARHAQLLAVLDSSLRGPLEQLRGELGTLADDPAGQLWPEANQILHHLSAGYARMSTLVDNVLAYQRLDAGETKLARRTVPLDEVVAAGVEGAVELIGPGRAQFAVHAPAIEAEIDAERFAQALAHLIADVAGVDATGHAAVPPRSSGDSTIVVAAAQRGEVVRIEVRGPFAGGDPVHGPIVRGIVRAHGGVLQTHDMPGAGGNAYVLEVPVSAANGPVTGTPERPVTDAMNATTVMPVPAQRARGTAAPKRPEEAPEQPQPTGRRRARPCADEEAAATDGAGFVPQQGAPAPTGRRARRDQRPAEAEAPRTAFALPPAEADRTPEPTGRRARRTATEAPERPVPGRTAAEPDAPRTAFALPAGPSAPEKKDTPADAAATPQQGQPGPFPAQGGTPTAAPDSAPAAHQGQPVRPGPFPAQGGMPTAAPDSAPSAPGGAGAPHQGQAAFPPHETAGGASSAPGGDANPARPGDGAAPYAPAGGTAAFLGDPNHGPTTGGSAPDGTPAPPGGWPAPGNAPSAGAPRQTGGASRPGSAPEGTAHPAAAPAGPGEPPGPAGAWPAPGNAPSAGTPGHPATPGGAQGGGTAAFLGDPGHGSTTGGARGPASAPEGNASQTGDPAQPGANPAPGPPGGWPAPGNTPSAGAPRQGGGTGSAPGGHANPAATPAPPGGWPAPGNAAGNPNTGGTAAFLTGPGQGPGADRRQAADNAGTQPNHPPRGTAPAQGGPGDWPAPGDATGDPNTGGTAAFLSDTQGTGAAADAPRNHPARSATRTQVRPGESPAPGTWPTPGDGAAPYDNAGGTAAFLGDPDHGGAGRPAAGSAPDGTPRNHPAPSATRTQVRPGESPAPGTWPAPGDGVAPYDADGDPNQGPAADGAQRPGAGSAPGGNAPVPHGGWPAQGGATADAGAPQGNPARNTAGWPAPGDDAPPYDAAGHPNTGGTGAFRAAPGQGPAAGEAARPQAPDDAGTQRNHPTRGTARPGGSPAPAQGAGPAPHDAAAIPADDQGPGAGRPGTAAAPDGAGRPGTAAAPDGADHPQGHPASPAAGAPRAPAPGAAGEAAAPAGADSPQNTVPSAAPHPEADAEPTPPTGRRRARRALAEEPGAADAARPINVRMLGQGPGSGETPPGGTPVGSGRRRKLGNPSEEERQTPTPSAAAPRPQTPGNPQGRAFAIGAPDDGSEGPEPLDGPNSAVEVVNTPRPPMDDELPPEPLDNPRRLLVWPAPDDSTRTALTERGYRPVIVHSREEVDAQIAAYPAALFVDPLTGPITRTALQSLREAAVAAEVPVLVTAGLGQAAKEAAYGADPAVLLKALAPRDSEMHPSRVLLIEEHEAIADALTATLERRGMQVARATGDADAVTLAAELRPNLVVMDLMQVRRRRAGIVDWLRGHGLLSRTPLVVYTSPSTDPTQLALLAAGETVLFLAERSTSAEVQGRIVDLLSKLG